MQKKTKQKQLIESYVKERNTALFSLDEGKIRKFMEKNGIPIPEQPDAFWGAVYKVIVNTPNAPVVIRRKAEIGLRRLGMDRSFYIPKIVKIEKKETVCKN